MRWRNGILLLPCLMWVGVLPVLAQTIVQCPRSDGTSCTLRWDKNTEPDMKEYRVYAAEQGQALVKADPIAVIDHDPAAESMTTTLEGVTVFQEGAVYELAVTAVDQAGNESDFSNSVFIRWDTAPKPPTIELILE